MLGCLGHQAGPPHLPWPPTRCPTAARAYQMLKVLQLHLQHRPGEQLPCKRCRAGSCVEGAQQNADGYGQAVAPATWMRLWPCKTARHTEDYMCVKHDWYIGKEPGATLVAGSQNMLHVHLCPDTSSNSLRRACMAVGRALCTVCLEEEGRSLCPWVKQSAWRMSLSVRLSGPTGHPTPQAPPYLRPANPLGHTVLLTLTLRKKEQRDHRCRSRTTRAPRFAQKLPVPGVRISFIGPMISWSG